MHDTHRKIYTCKCKILHSVLTRNENSCGKVQKLQEKIKAHKRKDNIKFQKEFEELVNEI